MGDKDASSGRKRDQAGRFAPEPNSGQPQTATAHSVDLTAAVDAGDTRQDVLGIHSAPIGAGVAHQEMIEARDRYQVSRDPLDWKDYQFALDQYAAIVGGSEER